MGIKKLHFELLERIIGELLSYNNRLKPSHELNICRSELLIEDTASHVQATRIPNYKSAAMNIGSLSVYFLLIAQVLQFSFNSQCLKCNRNFK